MEKVNYLLVLLFSILASFLFYNVQGRLEGEGIIGGRATTLNELKYMVAINRDDKLTCSGGIIDDWHIISAAHCFVDGATNLFKDGRFTIVVGTNDLNVNVKSAFQVTADQVFIPSTYNGKAWNKNEMPVGDIALIKLKQSLDLASNTQLQSLRLPKPNEFDPTGGKLALIAGFGWDKLDEVVAPNGQKFVTGSTSNRLNKAEVKTMNHIDCKVYFIAKVRESSFCAYVIEYWDRSAVQGTCNGDSGSPLVYQGDLAVGIMSSSGIYCNENEYPGIYTSVSSHLTFIHNALKGITTNMRVHRY